jgi:hypothetical protein
MTIKVKLTLEQAQRREMGYSFTLSLTWALDGGWWPTTDSGRFTPAEMIRYPLYWRLAAQQCRSKWVQKTSPPPGFDPQTVLLVASLYTDYVIAAQQNDKYLHYYY